MKDRHALNFERGTERSEIDRSERNVPRRGDRRQAGSTSVSELG
jgi:hypothetical protein